MLWHKDIRFPSFYTAPTQRVPLKWSEHAHKARKDDRYGMIPVFDSLPLKAFEVIEVETSGTEIVKYLVRGHYSADLDIVFALKPGPKWLVKTVWYQERNDLHRTLNRSKYVK